MIRLFTARRIRAPRHVCYDLIRDIDTHRHLATDIAARPEGGKTSGLSCWGDRTLWSASFLGLRFRMWMLTDCCDWPVAYGEANIGGPFQIFEHRYRFVADGDDTLVADQLHIAFPGGALGQALGRALFVPRIARQFERRMDGIRDLAEGRSPRGESAAAQPASQAHAVPARA